MSLTGVVAITGKTGQGKGLVTMGLIVDYLRRGKMVATNIDIFVDKFRDPYNDKIRIIRLPDYPTAADLWNLGYGAAEDVVDEDDFGLLVLDEAATWLNSRDWNKPGNREYADWFVQRRKFKWNVGVLIQRFDSLDTSVREAVISHEMRAYKVERVNIPLIMPIIKELTGQRYPKFPKWLRYHKATTRNLDGGFVEDVTRYRGTHWYALYDTLQKFRPDCGFGPHSLLTPWHLKGRYLPPRWGVRRWFRFLLQFPFYLSLWIAAEFDPATREFCRRHGYM